MATLPLVSDPSPSTSVPRQTLYVAATPSSSQQLIAAASSDAWLARANSRLLAAQQMRARVRVAAIDAMLEILELRHLAGERTFDKLTRARLRRLERVVGMPLPRKAVRARNTVRLHAALLDWQEQVLNQVAPERRRFDDIYDTDWNAPTPDYSTAS